MLSSFSTNLNSFELNHLYSQVDYPASQAQSSPDHNLLWLPESSGYPTHIHFSALSLGNV